MKQTPELIIKSQPIDMELAELLGKAPCDFVVLCFDGVQFEAYGTPIDSPEVRHFAQRKADMMNDKSEDSIWPAMWHNWKPQICKQFGLPETATEKDFRPVVSWKVVRVCVGYSEHLHAAICLFEAASHLIAEWAIGVNESCWARIVSKTDRGFTREGKHLPRVIAEVVRDLLRDGKD